MKEQGAYQLHTILFRTTDILRRLIADNLPKVIAAFDRLHTTDQSTHAVTDQHHLIKRSLLMIWINGLANIGQVLTQLVALSQNGCPDG